MIICKVFGFYATYANIASSANIVVVNLKHGVKIHEKTAIKEERLTINTKC